MSEYLRGDSDRLSQNSLMSSFFLSQGDADLQINILHTHFARNPDQFGSAVSMLSSRNLCEGLAIRTARYLNSGLHKRDGFDDLIHDVLEDIANNLIELDMDAPPDFFGIGTGILDQDIKYLKGRPGEHRPTVGYSRLHPRASQFAHYGILYPKRNISRVESVATSAASTVLNHIIAIEPDNPHISYDDLELSRHLSLVLGRNNDQFPQFRDDMQPFIDQANILASKELSYA